MAIFSNNYGRHADGESVISFKKTKLIIILSVISIIVMVGIILAVCLMSNKTENDPQKETKFVEQPVQTVKDGELITINDPELGEIQIEAVEGFDKNTYDNNNFITDDNGIMTYYVDGEVASCAGVDLSDYQGEVDFDKLKSQGISFVMLRIAGRYYSEKGGLYMDESFFENYSKAKKAGLDVGGYFFSQAKNAEEGAQEASFVISKLSNLSLDYPIAFDWEIIEDDTARTDSVTGEELTDAAIAFCDTLNENGYKAMIYSNTNLMYYKYDLERVKDIDFWIADYENHPSMYYNFTMWQYSINGNLDGIEGDVDLNICLKNY